MTPTPDDASAGRLKHLGGYVRDARLARQLTIDEAATNAGISARTWLKVEHGAPVRDLSYGPIEKAFGWRSNMLRKFLDGTGQLDGDEAPTHQVYGLSAPAAGEHEGRPVPPGFGEWLVNARFRAGYVTSEDLGKAVGIATKLIEDWEDGKSGPHAVDVFALASALRLPVLTVAAQAGHVNPTAAATQELMDDPAVSDEKKAAIRQVVDWARQQRAAG